MKVRGYLKIYLFWHVHHKFRFRKTNCINERDLQSGLDSGTLELFFAPTFCMQRTLEYIIPMCRYIHCVNSFVN